VAGLSAGDQGYFNGTGQSQNQPGGGNDSGGSADDGSGANGGGGDSGLGGSGSGNDSAGLQAIASSITAGVNGLITLFGGLFGASDPGATAASTADAATPSGSATGDTSPSGGGSDSMS
jgi:hypothetical protein